MTAARTKQPEQPKQPEAGKAAPKPQPTTTATTQPPAPSKQEQTLGKLKEAWTTRGVNLSEMKTKQDGKFLFITVAANWPVIRLGATGGIELPEIRSYAKAFDAAVIGDQVLAKQKERDSKKQAAPAPKPQTAVGKQPGQVDSDTGKVVEKETAGAKKRQQDAKLEQKLQAQA